MLLDDHGVHIYEQSIITHADTVKNDPELCGKFVRASLRGWEYAIEHPEEAIDAFVRRYPEKNRDAELMKFIGTLPLVRSGVTEKYGFGYHVKKIWKQTQKVLLESGTVDHKIDLDDFFTTRFIVNETE